MRSYRIRFHLGLLIAVAMACFGASDSRGDILSFTFTDSASDRTGIVEVTQIEVTFDNSTGDFVTHVTADPSAPFIVAFRVNLHVINPDTPTFTADPAWFADALNECDVAAPTTTIMLSGNEARLMEWDLGDRVASDSVFFGIPPDAGPSQLHSGVFNLPFSGLGDGIVDSTTIVSAAGFPSPTIPCDSWDWTRIPSSPSSFAATSGIVIDPEDDDLLYVMGQAGLFISRDGGGTWENPLPDGLSGRGFVIDPEDPGVLWAGGITTRTLYRSPDRGKKWSPVHTFDQNIRSVHVSPDSGYIYVGPQWGLETTVGVYRSTNGGASWSLFPFPSSQPGFLLWVIEEDTTTNSLYVSGEITPTPSPPYTPPFLRSDDQGQTWVQVTPLPWHSVELSYSPMDQLLFALTESLGVYQSADAGATWQFLGNEFYLGTAFHLDQNRPDRFYGGRAVYGVVDGGAFVSETRAVDFAPIGLRNLVVGGFALNATGTRLYAAVLDPVGSDGGVWVADVPLLTAGFEFGPGKSALEVAFSDVSTGSPIQWSWDFGDAGASTLQNPAHEFAAPGTYDVVLTVMNTDGSAVLTRSVRVVAAVPTAGLRGLILLGMVLLVTGGGLLLPVYASQGNGL